MSRTEEFEEARPLLFSPAHHVLGSTGDARNAVEETWQRYTSAPLTAPEDPNGEGEAA